MLTNGQPLPAIEAKTLANADVAFADMTDGSWSVVLLYRGHW